jgi:hypothetical protein
MTLDVPDSSYELIREEGTTRGVSIIAVSTQFMHALRRFVIHSMDGHDPSFGHPVQLESSKEMHQQTQFPCPNSPSQNSTMLGLDSPRLLYWKRALLTFLIMSTINLCFARIKLATPITNGIN